MRLYHAKTLKNLVVYDEREVISKRYFLLFCLEILCLLTLSAPNATTQL